MSEEKVKYGKNEEPIINTNKKKRIVIIITSILLLIVSVGTICILKYKAEHKYIPYEELSGEQIVVATVSIGKYDGQIQARIHALDAEGDLYEMLIPTDKWVGIEYLYEEIQDNKIQANYEYGEERTTEIRYCLDDPYALKIFSALL